MISKPTRHLDQGLIAAIADELGRSSCIDRPWLVIESRRILTQAMREVEADHPKPGSVRRSLMGRHP